ncbi:GGDEF domain-containing protein [Sulfuricurvum sp.]|uniref:GGDEF domain-containing protein n=1 Tax=Sulfuricurvum sp. TaxID=2025608 RepID=UPI00260CA67F|nr:GGDEF domain-containing protein [Sulfuricurvum sp.]MDD2781336.1 GGDEF domain-containing protein [Sulfuricurvum sp.]
MSVTKVYDKIFSIHDQTVGTLRALKIAPYPTHYKKYFDEIFIEQADAALIKAQKEDENIAGTHDELTRYLDIAHRSIMSFVETHADISHVAELQNSYINKATEEGIERCVNFVEGLSELGKNMSDELKKAQTKIEQLSSELQEALEQLTTDPLTQITNRKGLIDDLNSAILAGQNKMLPMVIMMIDADNFKQLNDMYGHLAGDKVLYFLAQSIKSVIRSGDKVYRYGGEEFAVVLNRCEKDQAFAVADKIRSKIEHSHLIYSGKTIHMTVSVGASIHHLGDSYDTFLGRADKALYTAKNEGKNKTVLFD